MQNETLILKMMDKIDLLETNMAKVLQIIENKDKNKNIFWYGILPVVVSVVTCLLLK